MDRDTGRLALLAPRIKLALELRQPPLTLPGQLLDLEELPLDIGDVGRDPDLEIAEGLATRDQRVQDPLLEPDHVGERRGADGIAAGGFNPHRAKLALEEPDLALGGARGEDSESNRSR